MSDKLREAAQAAVDLLKDDDCDIYIAIRVLEAALAEPEPVAWYHNCFGTLELSRVQRLGWSPLYSAPPRREWVGLTGPEVDEAYGLVSDKEWAIGGLDDARVFFCAIEAKLKEKNT